MRTNPVQQSLPFSEEIVARSLLDQLLDDSKLYKTTKDYEDLLDFVVRLRNFAPFNAMLLQVQKPGLQYAASARDWRERFGRYPIDGARPLLILWPFGPVALVYDVVDTEGKELPQDVVAFYAHGKMDEARMLLFLQQLGKKKILSRYLDYGDAKAGSIALISRPKKSKEVSKYLIRINRNHPAPVQFSTLAHELSHLFLGHLGPDKNLQIPRRRELDKGMKEIEAESVTYIVCARNKIKPNSEKYLSNFTNRIQSTEELDFYQIMRAAGQVEAILGLSAKAKFDKVDHIH